MVIISFIVFERRCVSLGLQYEIPEINFAQLQIKTKKQKNLRTVIN